MKRINIAKIGMLPVIVFTVMAFTNLQPQKNNDKKDKSREHPEQKAGNQGNDDTKKHPQKDDKHVKAKDVAGESMNKNNPGQGNNKSHQGKHESDMSTNNNKHAGRKGNSKIMNGKRGEDINWNLENFANRKHPKDQKKVTICHNPTENGSNGVTISVSENALKAHMNHGDKMNECNVDYSDRWSSSYVKSRENVYNTYERTWESMSYSEALLTLAANKLLGAKTNLDRSRTSLASQEIQRREALISDLQNNVNSLENQLDLTRQRLDSDVNLIIQL